VDSSFCQQIIKQIADKGEINMARAKKRTFEKDYTQIPNETIRAVEIKDNENPISLEAFALIANLFSYPDSWELHKTELYKRFAFNKETSVRRAWNELVKAGYIVEYKFRNGKKWEYEYVYNILPYTEEQREIIRQEGIEDYGEIWGLDFQDLKTKTSKCRLQNQDIINKDLKKNELKKNTSKKKTLDDDDKEPFEINIFAFKEFKKDFEDNFPNTFDEAFYGRIIEHMTKLELDFITYPEAVEQLKYMAEQREKGLIIADSAKYFVGGIELRRTSRAAAMDKAKLRRAEKELKARKEKQEKKQEHSNPVPFYNWLEQ
jgi:hypothetical protein